MTIQAFGEKRMGTVGGSDGYIGTSDRRVFFGLGAKKKVDLVEIFWPSGRRQEFLPQTVDRIFEIREAR